MLVIQSEGSQYETSEFQLTIEDIYTIHRLNNRSLHIDLHFLFEHIRLRTVKGIWMVKANHIDTPNHTSVFAKVVCVRLNMVITNYIRCD